MTNGQRIYIPTGRTVTIANAGTTSGALDLQNATVLAIRTPAAFTGTTLTFTTSDTSGGTFDPLYGDDGTQYSVTVSTSRLVALDYTKFLGVLFLKVVSGSAEGGARTLTLYVRPLA